MIQNEYKQFLKKSDTIANDESHRLKILKAVSTHEQKVSEMINSQFCDWEQARGYAAAIKNYALDHLPELLEEFEKKITERGTTVLWAKDKQEARQHF